MKRAKLMEERMIGVLREHEAGVKAAGVAAKHGISEAKLVNFGTRAVWQDG